MAGTMLMLSSKGGDGQGTVRNCEEGEICTDKNDCLEYIKYLSLKEQTKIIESRRLMSKVCNRKPDRLCCKGKTTTTSTTRPSTMVTVTVAPREASGAGIRGTRNCEEGDICMDKDDCREYLRVYSLT